MSFKRRDDKSFGMNAKRDDGGEAAAYI